MTDSISRRMCWVVGMLLATVVTAAPQPNVVMVITDDQGYGDLGCHGNPVLKTPVLDRLHAQSVRLTDYHVAPTCAPTRAALLTGHWTNRTGVWHTIMGRSLLRANEVTLATILKKSGYRTAMFGKWHLGDNYPYRPEDRGFEEVLRHGGGGVGQTPDYWDNAYFDDAYFHNGEPKRVRGFCTDVFFDYAIRFIERVKDDDKPFFVYLATNAPHGPFHCPTEYVKPYTSLNGRVANFFGMIANIDENVGKLREYLEGNGLTENTIFIFTTDNGTASGQSVFNDGMRGKKGSQYDGGHRVPFFMYWPGGGFTGGRDVDMITSYVDVVPTLIDLCGARAPANVKFDGVSIRPLLEGGTANWPDRLLVTDSQRVRDPIKWRKSAVMSDQWRLIDGKQLYDIRRDKGQQKDVAGRYPEVVKRMRDFYDAWWAELEPTFGKPTAIYLGHPEATSVRLTCHDWIAERLTPWNQSHIRKAEAKPTHTGFWAVQVVTEGEYEVELRRWPREADRAITAALDAGKPVPGLSAFRETPGKPFAAVKAELKLGGQTLTVPVKPGDKGATFRLRLKPGRDELWTRFIDVRGKHIGAYYAYVRKL